MNDLILLALLFDQPKHGYQLKREAGFILGQREMHNNLVYPLLRRFTQLRWVAKKATPGERGQTRQQYSLTKSGRQELLRRLAEFGDEEARSLTNFTTRVGLFELLDPETRTQILERRDAHLHEVERHLEVLKANMDIGTYGAEVVRFYSERGQAEMAWIERLRRMQKQKARAGAGGANIAVR